MNKAVLFTVGFVSGAALGIVVGYHLNKKESEDTQYVEPIQVDKKPEEPKPEKTQKDISEKTVEPFDFSKALSKPAKIATAPGETGINYTQYVKDLKYKQETQSPPDDDPDDGDSDIPEGEELDMSKYEETYEERLERESKEMAEQVETYKQEHKGKIELMQEEDWDTDFPETDYEREDLYYFTESDILTDEDGNHLDEEETIGKKVRQVGWMRSPDEVIYIRNHPKEKEYRVFKERCAVEDWF